MSNLNIFKKMLTDHIEIYEKSWIYNDRTVSSNELNLGIEEYEGQLTYKILVELENIFDITVEVDEYLDEKVKLIYPANLNVDDFKACAEFINKNFNFLYVFKKSNIFADFNKRINHSMATLQAVVGI